ncbi:site-specific integrase [Janthinobacterium sp. NKUCC08_JDC]|uniref:tyrosine-type recombinase/integrase n=1 Tax=Janthinobacterium sp. NKUCC08_JDC TaxID=2842122 RepID=UPI00214C67CF|nr:site-specific integrase [Janthinobacterium sp. NKUCC08_JDC]
MYKTWDDAVGRWVLEKADKASFHSDLCILKWLEPHLSGMPLHHINRTVVDALTLKKVQSGVANGTVNRMLALLRSILRRAVLEWEWSFSVPRVRLLREPTRRVRYLTYDQAQRLLEELPAHLAEMAAFSLATGLRKSNVTGLQWEQVDLLRGLAWVHPDQSKSRRAIPVPLNADAMRVLALRVGRNPRFVFALKGDSIARINNSAWKNALKSADIADFRWHDLRHTWASWHVQNGTPLNVLQELGGWESPQMVRRYAHFSAEHLSVYSCNLPSLILDNDF